MTSLTASQVLGAYAGPRDRRPVRGLRDLLRHLLAGHRPRHALGALPRGLLRDIGLDGIDLRTL